MPGYIFATLWSWFVGTGLNLALIIVIGVLVPRIGRLAMRIVEHRVESDVDEESGKNRLAFASVGLYIIQIIAFFLLVVMFLQQLGFSLAGAAIPATVASAAVGFGAQSIIADFLAGFFILTEKQFGIGDWVRFEGSGVVVEGTVVEVTMRATTIRTISQQTVIIPNSAAKVCINHSKEWSRAVVSIPVPMLGSENINEVITRSEEATRRALTHEEVNAVVIGELDVHPAVDVQPPTVVGMPWLVTMRFMVQVKAGNQWLVERAIRTQIIDEFWNEYGSATTTSGTLVDRLAVDDDPLHNPAEAIEVPGAYTRKPVLDVPVDSLSTGAGSAASRNTTELFDETPTATTAEVTEDGEIQPTPEGTHPNRPDVSMSVPPEDDTGVETTVEEKSHLPGVFRTDSYEKPWQKVLSLGGRVRMSTSLLLLGLAALLLVKLFTIEPAEDWEGSRGWLPTNNDEVVVTTPTMIEPTGPVIPEDTPPTEVFTTPTPTPTPTEPTARSTGAPPATSSGPVNEETPATPATLPGTPAPRIAPGTTPPTATPTATPTVVEPTTVGEGA